MVTNILIKLFTILAYLKARPRERSVGFRLVLNGLAPHWIPHTMTYDMTDIWKREGLAADGVNYFTIGSITHGRSERFNPDSPYYQAWLGGYVVRFSKPRTWTLAKHFALGVADQKNWLRIFGDRNPRVAVDTKSAKKITTLKISGYPATLYEGGIFSDTDVGEGNKSRIFLTGPWDPESPVTSYQPIYLYGYIVIVDITADTKAVLYGNGAKFTDRFGKNHDTFAMIGKELRHMLACIEIRPA